MGRGVRDFNGVEIEDAAGEGQRGRLEARGILHPEDAVCPIYDVAAGASADEKTVARGPDVVGRVEGRIFEPPPRLAHAVRLDVAGLDRDDGSKVAVSPWYRVKLCALASGHSQTHFKGVANVAIVANVASANVASFQLEIGIGYWQHFQIFTFIIVPPVLPRSRGRGRCRRPRSPGRRWKPCRRHRRSPECTSRRRRP